MSSTFAVENNSHDAKNITVRDHFIKKIFFM